MNDSCQSLWAGRCQLGIAVDAGRDRIEAVDMARLSVEQSSRLRGMLLPDLERTAVDGQEDIREGHVSLGQPAHFE